MIARVPAIPLLCRLGFHRMEWDEPKPYTTEYFGTTGRKFEVDLQQGSCQRCPKRKSRERYNPGSRN